MKTVDMDIEFFIKIFKYNILNYTFLSQIKKKKKPNSLIFPFLSVSREGKTIDKPFHTDAYLTSSCYF